jgi:acyl-CoA hydrolase
MRTVRREMGQIVSEQIAPNAISQGDFAAVVTSAVLAGDSSIEIELNVRSQKRFGGTLHLHRKT